MSLFGNPAFSGFEADERAQAPAVLTPQDESAGAGSNDVDYQSLSLTEFARTAKIPDRVVVALSAAMDFDPTSTPVADFAFVPQTDVDEAIAAMTIEGSPPSAIVKGQGLRLWSAARKALAAAGLAPPGVEPVAPPPPTTTLMMASPKASSPAGPPKTALKMSQYIDQADEGTFHMMDPPALRDVRQRYVDIFGDTPAGHENPSDEQLSGLKQLLDSGRCPYVDFGVFGQFNRRTSFFRKFEDQVLIDGRFRTMVIKGPNSYVQWKSSWRVYRNAMIMLGAGVPAHFDKYEEGIRQLVVAHGPRAWATLATADDLMRGEEWKIIFNDRIAKDAEIVNSKPWSVIVADTSFRVGEGVRTHWWWERVTAPLSRGLENAGAMIAEMEGNETGLGAGASVVGQPEAGGGKRRADFMTPRPKAKAKSNGYTNYCREWNNGGCRKPCPHRAVHSCSNCGGNHRARDCPQVQGKGSSNSGGGKGKPNGKGKGKNKNNESRSSAK